MAKQKGMEVKCTIEKVVRENGKSDATMAVTVPVSLANEIPLGKVLLIIQPLQAAIFGQNPEGDIKDPKEKKRGAKN